MAELVGDIAELVGGRAAIVIRADSSREAMYIFAACSLNCSRVSLVHLTVPRRTKYCSALSIAIVLCVLTIISFGERGL
jgi:hypothetical protein